jgi:hypothetical protein
LPITTLRAANLRIILRAEFAVKTPEVAGSRIRVSNTAGSSHVEEIVDWQPERRIQLDRVFIAQDLAA